MKLRIVLALLFVFGVSGCVKHPPAVNDDTIVSSTVDGVKLTYRHAITPPTEFHPINEEYRALYKASVMSRPDFGGNVVRYLDNGGTYQVLGRVQDYWMAVAEQGKDELIGYVPLRAVVKSDLYDATLRKDRPRKRRAAAKKTNCVSVDNNSQACKNTNSGTWIIQ
ncbi:SH3 domain-containing protein [Mangrovibacter yixingensis]|uniref:SH3 domain-containing protein n=1 Tax=Mangrovibacter yixingensis TaxID=1529639 RepID=UPI001CFDA9DE|nr:SH3 domain-containing protein [Mangrovibacter yixingensis]